MAYTGSVTLISGITQKNGLDFPLVNAPDVYVDDDNRLDDVLNANVVSILNHFTVDANGYICQITQNTLEEEVL